MSRLNYTAMRLCTMPHIRLCGNSDPQGSALAWSSAREIDPIFPVVGMPTPTLHRDLPQVARDYDHVVIDGAPRVNELGRAAIMASDLVLVPVQPSPYDASLAGAASMTLSPWAAELGVDHALVECYVEHRETELGEGAGDISANRRIYDFTIDRKYGFEAFLILASFIDQAGDVGAKTNIFVPRVGRRCWRL